MKFNEYGAELDRNGYAPSILQDDTSACYVCFGCRGGLDRHEVFFGPNRTKSKSLGLWVMLCHHDHHIFGPDAVHVNRARDLAIKRAAQRVAMETYGWDKNEFIRRFGRNYMED